MLRDDLRAQPVELTARAPWSGRQRAGRRTRQRADPDLITGRWSFGRQVKEVLFVDPAPELQRTAQQILRSIAKVDVCSTFSDAHKRLMTKPPDLLVTALRLHAHNGLHLVYLATALAPSTRCVVSVADEDISIAREVEAAGGFLVRAQWLAAALTSFATTTTLPGRDRRDAGAIDRRRAPRGGRRYSDSWVHEAVVKDQSARIPNN